MGAPHNSHMVWGFFGIPRRAISTVLIRSHAAVSSLFGIRDISLCRSQGMYSHVRDSQFDLVALGDVGFSTRLSHSLPVL